MPKLFLINIGANSAHQASARCPIFPDGSFVYVPFPLAEEERGSRPYPADAWPFTHGLKRYQTHADPDWENLTYGDYVLNGRAGALKAAMPSDILLFWSLLWRNNGDSWATFTNQKEWHLVGALRIEEILVEGQSPRDALPRNRWRAKANAHFGGVTLYKGEIVFIGDQKKSALFDNAVPLVTELDRSSLLYRTFRTKAGEPLPLKGKHWSSYTRSCRAICDLDDAEGRERAGILRDAILEHNDYDLLTGL